MDELYPTRFDGQSLGRFRASSCLTYWQEVERAGPRNLPGKHESRVRFPRQHSPIAYASIVIMSHCCEDKACALEQLSGRQSGTLKVVLAINAAMFFVVLAAAVYASSSALLADSLDNLGDALTYALSLYVAGRSDRAKGMVSMFKGALILAAALFVVGQIAYRLVNPGVPLFETMGAAGALALTANATCLGLLWKHRHEDVNMASVWECSRNDIAGNIAVLVAAVAVRLAGSGWPDLLIASLLVALLLRSALRVFRASFGTLRASAS